MKRFCIALTINIVLLVGITFHATLATHLHAPLYTHFVYMFAHANILHWALNAWAIMSLHRIVSLRMLAASYCAAVAVSFLAQLPTVGASAAIFFVLGCLARTLRTQNRKLLVQILIYLLIAFFLPGVAAVLHIAAFALGICYIELLSIFFQLKKILDDNA